MLIVLFLVSHFNFLFVPCGRLSWLPVSFLLHVKYTLSYCIVSYRIMYARSKYNYKYLRCKYKYKYLRCKYKYKNKCTT